MYKVEYIRWDTPKEEVDRLVKEHNLDKAYVHLVQADYKTTMVISAECALSSYYTDNGEPEDATFYRDWSWVKTELERAYELGKRDAYDDVKLHCGI